jgi:hypothetical protein
MGDHGDSARLQSEFRLAAVLSEDDGCEPVEDRISLIVRRNIGENEPLGLHDPAIHTPARIFGAGGERMTIRQAPPTRASNSQIVFVKPVGPHHRAMCSGSVHALKTRLRGASKTRVMTTPRSATFAVAFVLASIFVTSLLL